MCDMPAEILIKKPFSNIRLKREVGVEEVLGYNLNETHSFRLDMIDFIRID